MKSMPIRRSILLLVMLVSFFSTANAEQKAVLLKPFTLAKIYKNNTLKNVVAQVQKQLQRGGYQLIGNYQPYPETMIFIITDNTLLRAAAKSRYGGFGAALRVSVTQYKDQVQVVHNNPTYIGIAYRMNDYLSSTRKKLAKTVGYVKDFGGKGIDSRDLGDYNYAFGLEGFTGFMDLAEHSSHAAAIKFVEQGFGRELKKMKKVYRLDIPGKQQTIFGVSLKNDTSDQKFLNDGYVMEIIDSKELRRSAHLPYEIMVSGKRVFMMHPHFRLAINFPDLRMFGKHSFGQLMDLPYVYEEYFIQLAGGVWPIPEEID